jgi:hypothetical protein
MIVTVYCGDLPGKLRKRYPGEKILTFAKTRGDLATIRKADDGSPIRLLGYSAGCSGVRELCAAGLRPAEVFTFDGTHASFDRRPQTMPLGEWRDLYARAQRGELSWVASHIYNTYTEQLDPGPYKSTVTVLREVTGELLPMPAEGAGPTYTRPEAANGHMVIASYRSGSCDKEAHGKQINTYAEQLCESFLSLDARPLGPSVGTLVANVFGALSRLAWPFAGPGMTLGAAVLQEALKSLEARVSEAKGKPNAGIVVDAWLAEVGAPSPNNWCAASVAHWLRMASTRLGVKAPIAGSAGAKATKAQFEQAGRWIDIAKVRADKADLIPGMVPVWHRGKPGDWTGHIGILETVPVDGLHFTSIEGNSGPTGTEVARMTRRLDDPLLLGFGRLDL